MYEQIAINCYRHFQFKTQEEVDNLSLYEYQLKMKAKSLERLDNQLDIHLQAWVNQQATATDKKGKSIFNNFDDFFDYDKQKRKILYGEYEPEKKQDRKLIYLLQKANGERR